MKVPKSRGGTGGVDISVVHPHAAEIDIGAQFHVAALGPGRDPEPVRSFRSFTKELRDLAKWLKQAGATTVATESTGVYWIVRRESRQNRCFTAEVGGRKPGVSVARSLSVHALLVTAGCEATETMEPRRKLR